MALALCIALLGYGEAGSAFGQDLRDGGADVRAYDPRVEPPDTIRVAASEAEAVHGADLILSANSASSAADALLSALPSIKEGAVWADMNTASPRLKEQLCEIAGQRSIAFADVAIMAPLLRSSRLSRLRGRLAVRTGFETTSLPN